MIKVTQVWIYHRFWDYNAMDERIYGDGVDVDGDGQARCLSHLEQSNGEMDALLLITPREVRFRVLFHMVESLCSS